MGELIATLGRYVVENVAAVEGAHVLVACSGGADSLALAAATHWASQRADFSVGAVIVDHQLQAGSDSVAQSAATACESMGIAQVQIEAVTVDVESGNGLEAAARDARRAALARAAAQSQARAVLLAHTLDDQAETVLLRLTRGSGSRTLGAMAPVNGVWHRPFLSVRRAQTRALCSELNLAPHHDPHNDDPRFARVRVRHEIMPTLISQLGPDVVTNLARTAQLCRQDDEALSDLASAEYDARTEVDITGVRLRLGDGLRGEFANLPLAIRGRVIRAALLAAGAPAGSLTAGHIGAVDAMAIGPRGKGPVRVPGDLDVARTSDKLAIGRGPSLRPQATTEEG